MVTIRRLRPGDEAVLGRLAAEAPEFGMSDDGRPLAPLADEPASAYLGNAHVIHMVAFDEDLIVGTMVAIVMPLPVSPGVELLLHEIGVREGYRRLGVGSALLHALDEWMRSNGVDTVWLLADGIGAESFYTTCGFRVQPEQPCYMLRSISESDQSTS